jgi:CDP-diacylglycerol---glycerol-3-phosphate 3-phosphatidyltransferase
MEKIETIRAALRKNPNLRVSILTDALRGTRETPDPSCASLLAPLVEEFGEKRVEIRMFHTPNLNGVRKAVVPRRINEGWGLQHMKLYGIDDEIILSGANLSSDYFTDRQDRYHLFSSPELADYFARVHHAIGKLSFNILPSSKEPGGYTMTWPPDNPSPSPLEEPKAFKQQATTTLGSLMRLQTLSSKLSPNQNSPGTLVYPLFQFTPLLTPKDCSTELPALRALLSLMATPAWTGSSWTFTAGYFNMSSAFRRLLFRTIQSGVCDHGTVIAASPWANGFYKSKGVSGMLPDAYTLLSKRFLESLSRRGLYDRITLKEWRKGTVNEPEGWTYHAKGIWVTLPSSPSSQEEPPAGPSISVVGSSNYTKRSYSLDIEANVMIVTQDKDLQRRLGEEEKWLQEHAKPMSKDDYAQPDRKVGWNVRLAMWVVTILGGAL